MEKKVFNVSGFDCAHCASKAEQHIAKHKDVSYARLDFSNNKLYITFKENSWDCDKLASIIKEVESDPLDISEEHQQVKQTSLFNKKMKWQLIRVAISVIFTLICIFALGKQDLSWVRFSIYTILMVIIGYDIFYKVILHIKNRSNILDHNLLILIATLGSLSLAILALVNNESNLLKINDNYYLAFDNAMEAVLVMVLFQIGSVIEYYASNKSKMAITNAINMRAEKANLIMDDEIKVVSPEELQIDDLIIVTSGELIPIDGVIFEGDGYVDTSSLTGEYLPVHINENSEVYAGYMLKSGTVKVRVSKTYENSSINKIINLINSSGEKKSRADRFVDRFSKWYTPIIVFAALLTFILGSVISDNWTSYIHTALEILVIGCPCAIVISVPLAYFSALGLASSHGVLIKGSNYLDELSRIEQIYTDKTGTLTEGYFKIVKINPINSLKEELLEALYAAESLSTHPIAKAILHDVDVSKISSMQKDFLEEAGLGASSTYLGHKVYAGNDKLLAKYGVKVEKANDFGTIVYVAKDNQYLGYVVLNDVVKESSRNLISYLHKENIKVTLLTGDNESNAKEMVKELSIDGYHASLLPEDKMTILEKEMGNANKITAFVGDGINDAPAIRRSDVGIAMGGIGSDAAVENADVVIMNDDPYKIATAMKISKIARHTSIFNIIFALSIKLIVMVLAILFPHWTYMMYIAVISDTGLTVLLTINSLLILKRKVK